MEKHYDNIYIKKILYSNLYVIKGLDGDILIDTGFIGIKKPLKKWLDKFNIKLIILTHAHVDHTWNTAYIKKLYNCEVAMGIKDIENIDNSNINSEPLRKTFTLWTKIMNWGMKHFTSPYYNVDILLKDNQTINKCGLNLKIHALPGHTNGSIGIKYKDYLFVGDALVNRGKITIAYQNQNTIKAKKSFLKILRIKPQLIFFGHDKVSTLDKLERAYKN